MKRDSDYPIQTSRRTFTKSAAAALLTAQFACRTSPSPTPCTCPEPTPGQAAKCPSIIPGLDVEPHEPPIIITGGSFRLDMNRELADPATITDNAVRHFRYFLTERSYGNIHRVQVITEREKFLENFFYYPNQLCHLRIWLQKRMGDRWDPPNTNGEPQILIAFRLSAEAVPEFLLETDERLRAKADSHKPKRPNRYEHPGYSGGPFFRLAKWSLNNSTNGAVISDFEGDLTQTSADQINGFQFAVSFEDFPRLLERQKK